MEDLINSPEGRLAILRERVSRGQPLGLAALAHEFSISVDTVRRDLQALERLGVAHRVRGGALPVMRPVSPLASRLAASDDVAAAIASAAVALVEDGMVLVLDGGTTILRLAQSLPPLPRGLVVTPAPAVAIATLAVGTPTLLLGGRISPFGGMAVGTAAEDALADISADLCFLGACGLEATFGLGADDPDEAAVKRAMIRASNRAAVLTGAAKLGRRARHRVAPCSELAFLVTNAPHDSTAAFAAAGMEIVDA